MQRSLPSHPSIVTVQTSAPHSVHPHPPYPHTHSKTHTHFLCAAPVLLPQVELKATRVLHLGGTDAGEYPLAKKKQSYEFMREKAHLRPR